MAHMPANARYGLCSSRACAYCVTNSPFTHWRL